MKLLALAVCSVALTGCATAEYQAYADAHTARYQALADIAKQGDTAAKVAAVMSLQMGAVQNQPQVAAPKSFGDHLLQWTAVLLPTATQIYSVGKQAQVGIAQSNNARDLGVSTNAAFVGIAGKIQAPAANVTTTNTTTTTTNTDSTHAPTVVTQPAPIVVTQPAPITITQPAPVIVPTTTLTCTTGPC
jgi:spore germination protein YaaH